MKTLVFCFVGGLVASAILATFGFYSNEVEAGVAIIAAAPFAYVLFRKELTNG